MARVKFLPLSEIDPASACEFLVRVAWEQDWHKEVAENYFAWRYGRRRDGETLVAVDGQRCVGLLDAFKRPYWIADRLQIVRETCDWFCLQEYRALGVGLHLMRQMMAKPEPIVSVGGSEFTQDLLPRLKWARLPDLGNFILGLSARTFAGLLAHRRWPRHKHLARFVPNIPLRRLPRWRPPAKSEVYARLLFEPEQDLKTPYVVAPVLDAGTLDWLMIAPAVLGQFRVLNFFRNGERVGVSISRLAQPTAYGCVAQIVHLHPARFDMIGWMAYETIHHLAALGAGLIMCRTSCPITGDVLSALGFWRRTLPVYWWPAEARPPFGPLLLTALRSDDSFEFY